MRVEPPTTSLNAAWYRSYRPRGDDGCWYYASLPPKRPPGGRFDLPKPDGTCYWGETLEVAFRERIRRGGPDVNTVPEGLLDFVISKRLVERDLLVDLTHPDATKGTGVVADVLAGADYAAARGLAASWRTDFGGVLYRSRYALNHRAVALFGPEGEHPPLRDVQVERVSAGAAASLLGIEVLPARPSSEFVDILA